MIDSIFKGGVTTDSVAVGQGLFMSDGARFEGDVILRGAKVGGQLAMICSTFRGSVNMDSLDIGESLFMREGATFEGDVILNAGKVAGQLVMSGSAFKGGVAMESLTVGQSLSMHGKAMFEGQRDLFRLALARIDQTLPIVELNKQHSALIASPPLPQWALAWFYMQKLTGFLLGSFIVAGIAGLTQKS